MWLGVVSSMCHAPSLVNIQGSIAGRPTRMLVDTGSAVSLVREDVWREAHPGAGDDQLESPSHPIVPANGELLGRTWELLTVGGVQEQHPVLIARHLTQECLLGADFLITVFWTCTVKLSWLGGVVEKINCYHVSSS